MPPRTSAGSAATPVAGRSTGWVRGRAGSPACSRPAGAVQVAATVAILLALNVAALGRHRDDAAARVLGVMVSLLAAPVLHVMLFGRR